MLTFTITFSYISTKIGPALKCNISKGAISYENAIQADFVTVSAPLCGLYDYGSICMVSIS